MDIGWTRRRSARPKGEEGSRQGMPWFNATSAPGLAALEVAPRTHTTCVTRWE